MDKADVLLDKLRSHMSLEEEFAHRRFVTGLKQMSEADRDLTIELTHANYLIRGKILESIVKYCVDNDVDLPSFGDLIRYRQ